MSRAALAACALAGVTLYAGIHWGATVAGGADSYGYVSQAGLWRQGRLSIEQDIVRASPWPLANETWAPLGYRAGLTQRSLAGRPGPLARDVIVPLYPPGLPMLMALLQAIGGFCAAFLVVPICGALTVWWTYRLAERLFAAPSISVAAALLVATSPIFLYQLMNPMTDVPVTAAWTLAVALTLDGWPLASGLAASVAILIRPNLALVSVALCVWLMMTRGRATRFLIGLAPGVAAVATIDTLLYGAPWLSGYGAPDDLYAVRYALTNLRQFSRWLLETQTPLVLAAAIYFFVPQRIRPARIRYARLLLGGIMAAIGLSYLFYQSFDAWWYLRFLVPMWPAMMIAVAAAIDAIVRKAPARPVMFAACVLVLALNGVRIAANRSTFEIGRGERRYIDVARFVAGHTDPGAVMISLQHSGTLRLYADRLTLRFDQLDPIWLDRAAAFLQENSRHPYVVLDGDEVALFQTRFGAVSQIGRLDWRPMAALESPRVVIYDAIDRSGMSPDASPPLAIAAAASRRIGWRCDMPDVR